MLSGPARSPRDTRHGALADAVPPRMTHVCSRVQRSIGAFLNVVAQQHLPRSSSPITIGFRMSSHPRVGLLTATEPLLNALNDSRALFGELIEEMDPTEA